MARMRARARVVHVIRAVPTLLQRAHCANCVMSRVAAADVGDDAGKQRQTRMLAQRYREVVATLSPEQVEEFRKVFASFDRDGNGTMNAGELGPVRVWRRTRAHALRAQMQCAQAMRSLGHEPTDAELDEMVALVDSDKSVCIDFQEFLTLMALQLHQPFKQSEVMEAFQVRAVVELPLLPRRMWPPRGAWAHLRAGCTGI